MCCSLICWTCGKVRKLNGQNLLALKEVNLHNPAFGKDKKARDSSVETIVSELTIIKEQVQNYFRWMPIFRLIQYSLLWFIACISVHWGTKGYRRAVYME